MKVEFEIKEHFNVQPSTIYRAWLDSELHSKMTGGEANCSNQVGETFTAWNEYISGKNQELVANKKIVQTWRSVEFHDSDEDSLLTILLKQVPEGTELTLVHKNIPDGQPDYKQGWVENYFIPMKKYFVQQ